MDQTYHAHDVTDIFRTRFVDERQLDKETGGLNSGDPSDVVEERAPSPHPRQHLSHAMAAPSKKYGPEFPPQ